MNFVGAGNRCRCPSTKITGRYLSDGNCDGNSWSPGIHSDPQQSAVSKALSHANSLTCCQSSAILLNRDLKGRLGAVRQPKPSNVNRNKIQSRPFLAKLLFEMLRCVSYERHTGRKRRQAAHQERSCASQGCCDSAPHVPQGLDVAHSNELHTPAA